MEKVRCYFSVPLQNQTARLSLRLPLCRSVLSVFELLVTVCRVACSVPSSPPTSSSSPSALVGGWKGAYLLAAMVALCRADTHSPRMPRGGRRAPLRPSPSGGEGWGGGGGRKECECGGGGACPARPGPPHGSLRPSGPEGGTKLFLPPPSREGRAGSHRPTPTAAPRSQVGKRALVCQPSPTPWTPPKPLPSNQPTFNMTMAMTIPSSQGRAGEDIKHPPAPPPQMGYLPAGCLHRPPPARRLLGAGRPVPSRPGHERPPGDAAVPALPRRAQVRGLLLALPGEHGQRARRGGSAGGRPPLPRGGEDARPPRYEPRPGSPRAALGFWGVVVSLVPLLPWWWWWRGDDDGDILALARMRRALLRWKRAL